MLHYIRKKTNPRVLVAALGGSVPTLNDYHVEAIRMGREYGWDVIASSDGFNGLIEENEIRVQDFSADLGEIPDDFDGRITAIGSTKESCLPQAQEHVVAALRHLGIDYMILTGGDGSIRNVHPLIKATGIPTVLGVKSSDNDVPPFLCLGFLSALDRAISDAQTFMTSAASSGGLIYLMQIFDAGRGHAVLNAVRHMDNKPDAIMLSAATGWHYAKEELFSDIRKKLAERRKTFFGRPYYFILVGEDTPLLDGTVPKAERLSGRPRSANTTPLFEAAFTKALNIETRATNTGHSLRGGLANRDDARMGQEMAVRAMVALKEGRTGIVGRVGAKIYYEPPAPAQRRFENGHMHMKNGHNEIHGFEHVMAQHVGKIDPNDETVQAIRAAGTTYMGHYREPGLDTLA